MSKQVRRESINRVPRAIAKSRILDANKSKLSRPRHEGEIFMSRLLMNDSKIRLQHCYEALSSIHQKAKELDKALEYLTQEKKNLTK